jgi:hypothetical protein
MKVIPEKQVQNFDCNLYNNIKKVKKWCSTKCNNCNINYNTEALNKKVDKDISVNTIKVYIKNADGTQGMKLLSELESPDLVLTVTLPEFQTLISNSELKSGTTYRVNGLDGNFCDGFFKALTPNTFDNSGSGLFRNPNYSMIDLWTNQFYNGVTIGTGTPSLDDVFTNGTQSFIWKNTGLYIANQDSLPNGTYTSGAKSVTVNGADVWTYDVDDIVIFGNKHWKNVNGNLGAKVDELNLNAEWVEVFENLIYVVDLITYDIANDWISEREDSKGNEISLTKLESDDNLGDDFNYVKTFSWGKDGSTNNKIKNWFGVVCNLNLYISNNTGNGLYIYNNTVNGFNISNNTGNGFNISNNTGNGFNIYNNTGNGFNISNNTGNNLNIYYNTGNGFNIYNNSVNGLYIYNNTGNGLYIYEKSITSKTIQHCDFKNVIIDNSVNISASTILFGSYGKSVFRNSANQIIITYYNGNNVLVVANITD